ncbi:MAG: CAP domain-containing protein, partial [Proteobacteria bacterium]|nr:CAP domain-containing protein [Pseudomonadota bacterium]
IFCAVIYSRGVPQFPEVREQSPQPSPEPSKPIRSVPTREVLTGQAIITLTNNTRALNGLSPLKANPLLNAIAESRAKDMLEKQYFAHVSPTGEQASDIAQNIGYHYKIIAENIGSGNFYTNQKIVDGWMQSPGHRKNILTRDIKEMGAAVLKGDMKGAETYITVQIFGLQSPPVPRNICVGPQENLLSDIEIKKAEIAGLIDQSHRLKQELDSESEAIESDRGYTFNDPQKISSLNIKIRAHNEKSRWYNRVVVDAKAKSVVLSSMVKEYNRMLQAYNDCRKAN